MQTRTVIQSTLEASKKFTCIIVKDTARVSSQLVTLVNIYRPGCISEDEQTVKRWLSAMSLQSTANVCSLSKAADFQTVRLTDDYVS